MELTFDIRYNIAYIRLRPGAPEQVTSIRVSEELVVDIAPDGTVYGIELLDAAAVLGRPGGAELVVLNEATGDRSTVSLAGLPAA